MWGLQQLGIQAKIASNAGKTVYSNAMKSRLRVVIQPEDTVQALLDKVDQSAEPLPATIDVQQLAASRRVQTCGGQRVRRQRSPPPAAPSDRWINSIL